MGRSAQVHSSPLPISKQPSSRPCVRGPWLPHSSEISGGGLNLPTRVPSPAPRRSPYLLTPQSRGRFGELNIYLPGAAGTCRSVNSDQAPLINVEGRPSVQTACCRPGKPEYGGKCRYHAASINRAPPNMIYARLSGNPNRFVVPSQRAPTPEEYHQLFGVERPSFDAEGELLPEPSMRA